MAASCVLHCREQRAATVAEVHWRPGRQTDAMTSRHGTAELLPPFREQMLKAVPDLRVVETWSPTVDGTSQWLLRSPYQLDFVIDVMELSPGLISVVVAGLADWEPRFPGEPGEVEPETTWLLTALVRGRVEVLRTARGWRGWRTVTWVSAQIDDREEVWLISPRHVASARRAAEVIATSRLADAETA